MTVWQASFIRYHATRGRSVDWIAAELERNGAALTSTEILAHLFAISTTQEIKHVCRREAKLS